MIIVHYEVYVLEGRGWMLHARFPRTERETAITEAKELERTLNIRVKVLRETYYTDDNAFEESEVYVSGMKAGDKQKAPSPPHSPAQRADGGTAATPRSHALTRQHNTPYKRHSPPGKQRSDEDTAKARQLFTRLFAIVAVALAAALLSVKLIPNGIMLLWQMGFVITVTPTSYGQLMFVIFVLTFLMVAVPLAIRYVPGKTAMPEFSKWSPDKDGTPTAEDRARARAVKKALNKLASAALAETETGKKESAESLPEDESLPDIDPDDLPEIAFAPEDETADQDAQAKKDREKQETAERAKEDAAEKEINQETDKEKKQEDEKEKNNAAENADDAESLQPVVMRFLNGAVNMAKTIAPTLDAYTKFALHLYLAGAVETLCEFKKQGDSAKAKLVHLALETLGTRGDLARKFYEKMEEYLLEPRYLGVVQAGRNAMGDFMLGDEAGAHGALRDVFTEWNRKSDKKAQIVTVMFTDMVGSTDMTQARGDAAAQEVVRRHNSIVRGALAQYGGKEVKHTGDGIMASFGTSAAAVEATINIQRQVGQHNRRNRDSGLHLRIGLNAGEPIEEEDDLFGATVQLAARVCAATNPDQILCTGVVKDLAFGKGATNFRPMGDKYLKGFKDAVPLFEVVWTN